MSLRIAHDERAAVVLKRAGNDFARGSAELGNEHNYGSRPLRRIREKAFRHAERSARDKFARAPAGSLREHRGNAGADKKFEQVDGFIQVAAAVATQIQNDGFDFRLFEFTQKFLYVLGSGKRRFVRAVFSVKRGQADDAHGNGGIAVGNVKNFCGSELFRELHFVADQRDELAGMIVAGLDEKRHGNAFFAAQHADDAVKAHADDIGQLLAVPARRHGDDAVSHGEFSGAFHRRAGHDFANRAVAVFRRKHGADSAKRVAHHNFKFLHGLLGEK